MGIYLHRKCAVFGFRRFSTYIENTQYSLVGRGSMHSENAQSSVVGRGSAFIKTRCLGWSEGDPGT